MLSEMYLGPCQTSMMETKDLRKNMSSLKTQTASIFVSTLGGVVVNVLLPCSFSST